jgi:DNA-binding response OmpR family regulator
MPVNAPWPTGEKTVTTDTRVLVVEDEPNIRDLVCLHLGLEGYSCEALGNGRDALQRTQDEKFDLLVLDVMIPGLDGVSLCRAVRNGRTNTDVPILMLTAKREETDKVVGLESGADDYLTKPFGIRELVARTRALLRRTAPERTRDRAHGDGGQRADAAKADAVDPEFAQPPVQIHGITIDPARRRVRVDTRDVELTDQEFRLLHLFATHAGIVFSREALLSKIWRGDTYVTVRSVDTLVKRLRRRIESDPANPRYLITVWGVGYKFADV